MAKKFTRLEDLEVREVSIVDAPANQRRFLMVKSEESMESKGAEIVEDGQGNLVTDQGGSTVPDIPTLSGPASVLPVVKSEVPLSEIFKATGQNFEILEKRLSIDPDIRKEIFREIGDAMGRLNSVTLSADFAESDWRGDKDSTLVPILGAELLEVSKVIAGVGKRLVGSVKKNDEGNGEEFVGGLRDLQTILTEEIEKAGAKMSKGRLAQFKKAMDLLGSILGELGGAVPQGKAAETRVYTPPVVAPVVTPSDGSTELEKAFETLTTQITGLTTMVEKNASRVHSLERAPGRSNVIPVEPIRKNREEEDDDYWPREMTAEPETSRRS